MKNSIILEKDECFIYGWEKLENNKQYSVEDHENFMSKSLLGLRNNILNLFKGEIWLESCSVFVGTKLIINDYFYIQIKYKCNDEINNNFNKDLKKFSNLK